MDVQRLALVLTVALLLVTAGCLGGPSSDGETDDGERDDTDMPGADGLLQAGTGTDTIQGTLTTTTTSGEQSITMTQEVWLRPPNEHRMETVEGTPSLAGVTVAVQNETTMWLYFPEENQAVRSDPEPVVPSATEGAMNGVQPTVDPSEVEATRNGTATVADREAYVVEFTASGDTSAYESGTVWIDRETHDPLKQEMTLSSGDQELTSTYEFEEITFDEPIDDEVFAFDPPPDAEIREFDEISFETYDSIEDAEAEVPLEFPEPELPDGYALETATGGETLRGWTATLQYRNGEGTTVTVTVSEAAPRSSPLVDSEPVEVGGVNASITDLGETISQIEWSDDGVTYAVSADGKLERETLIDIAASIVE